MVQNNNKTNLEKWSFLQKFSFRFAFIFFGLYIFPFPLNYFGPISGMSVYLDELLTNELVLWVGKTIFNITHNITLQQNGSGDTTKFYIVCFIFLGLAIIGSLIWSIFDRKRANYSTTLVYFSTYIRYYLVTMMFTYGFSKIFVLQFSSLSLFDLLQTYGNSSPMGLMWNFMEYSDTYTKFTGYTEVIAGAFLLFRKTTLLGALLVITIMLNVFMLNMSYDIPVKLFSAVLILMGVFLTLPSVRRLIQFFITNKTIVPTTIQPYTSDKKIKNFLIVIKSLFILFLLGKNITNCLEAQKTYGTKIPEPALYGIYEVEIFIVNNDTIPPLTTNNERWKRLIIDKNRSAFQKMNDSLIRTEILADTIKKKMYVRDKKEYVFDYEKKGDIYIFSGYTEPSLYSPSDSLKIIAKRKIPNDYLLINRGFHWINEYPHNR